MKLYMHKKTLSSDTVKYMIVATSRNGQPCKTDKRPPFSNPINYMLIDMREILPLHAASPIQAYTVWNSCEMAKMHAIMQVFMAFSRNLYIHPEHVASYKV